MSESVGDGDDSAQNGRQSEGLAALQMTIAYLSSLERLNEALNRRAALLLGMTLAITVVVGFLNLLFGWIHWALAIPALIIAAEAIGCGYVLYPRGARSFIDPPTLVGSYRGGGWTDHEIAWVLVESLQKPAQALEKLARKKATLVRKLMIGLGVLVVAAIICTYIAWEWSIGGWAAYPVGF